MTPSAQTRQVFAITTLFISDLHLSEEYPEITRLFLSFLRTCAPRARQLYILGDLFEAWLGDDAGDSHSDTVINALQQLHRQGTDIAIMHGNRDFLLGQGFCDQSGCRLITDPTLIELDGKRVLLSHGDILCTDDHDYQKFRRQVRDPGFQKDLLALSVQQRRLQAEQYREKSRKATRMKAQDIMDVNAAAVEQMMDEYQVNCLIHGHTHRPAVHILEDKGIDGRQRIVLGDWGQTGSVLIHDRHGLHLHSFDVTTLNKLAESIAK